MCQCGCGDTSIERAFKIERGPTIGYQLYRGCADCHQGIGVDLLFYNRAGVKDWVSCKVEAAPKADEYGGNKGSGVAIPLFEVKDLIAASKDPTIDPGPIGPRSGYRTVAEWLEDHGLRLIQGALQRARERELKLTVIP